MWSIELFGVLLFFLDDSTCKIGGNSDDLPGIWVICKDQADTETLSDLVIKIFHDQNIVQIEILGKNNAQFIVRNGSHKTFA